MRRILQSLTVLVFLISCFSANAQTPPAQAGFTLLDERNETSLKQALESGYSLEHQRLWADALVHYEDAARKFPSNRDIRQRLQIVRIRFDLSTIGSR